MQCKIQVLSLGWEDPVEKGMATHSSILAWRIQGQRSLAGYSPWGCKESDWVTFTFHRYRHRYRDKHRSLARWVINQRRLKLMAKSSWLGWLLPESTTHSPNSGIHPNLKPCPSEMFPDKDCVELGLLRLEDSQTFFTQRSRTPLPHLASLSPSFRVTLALPADNSPSLCGIPHFLS